ncbi:MAG TPA: hypothetical protein VHU84_03865 [Lacipirellulaceae bacterium]|jgi:hypothetical protein|nr:hypothetical protein [Lacipirellulaceae bacterium]
MATSFLCAGVRAVGTSSKTALARFTLTVAALLGAPLLDATASGEIIVDDFDTAFQIVLPQSGTGGDTPMVQSNIGALNATRIASLVNLNSRPTGVLDANISTPSAVTLMLDRLHPTGTNAPGVSLNLQYLFDATDLTQGGANNRVALDFEYLQSAVPMPRVDVFIDGRGVGHGGELFNIPPSNTPFSLQVPFDATQLDAVNPTVLLISISPADFSGPDQINFSTAIDRIRITGEVPEPSAATLTCIAISVVVFYLGRRRICSWEIIGLSC